MLRQRAKYVVLGRGVARGVKVMLVEDERTKRKKKCKRAKVYDKNVFAALKKVWVICDGICGKRLAPFLPEIIPVLERWGELTLDKETRSKLVSISPATIDRMLAPARKGYQRRARTQTKPGTLLKHQIEPPRVFRSVFYWLLPLLREGSKIGPNWKLLGNR
ncbi:hypothetical protein KAH43_08980 [Candidatus Bipolaricaulota bacterium]|nr:hypothetical protein [Candidatus Bipolaricaulota bacterium]